MTIREIAAIAGVSPASVSLVLNNKRGVSETTRARIKKVLAEYNYSPTSQKKASRKRIRLVKYTAHGMAVEENQGFVASIIDQIESECRLYSFDMIMCGCNTQNAEEVFTMIAKDPMDGMILLGSEFDAANFDMLREIKAPIVVVDHSMQYKDVDSIVMDNAAISAAEVEYLYNLGHREIGYFLTNVKISNFTERYDGYLEALKRLGLTPPKPVLLTPTLNGAYADMKQLLESGAYVPKGAALAGNDSIAIGAVRALQEAGYRIPRDISIIGTDDIPFSGMTTPPLTTMRISRSVMGILTVDLLRKRIKHPEWPYMHVTISAELIERESTAPANPAAGTGV